MAAFAASTAGVDVERHLRNYESAKRYRTTAESHWRQVAEVAFPESDLFHRTRVEGEKRGVGRMFDASAAIALEKFSAIIESLLTPRAQTWHKLQPSDETLKRHPEARAWLDDLTRGLFEIREAPRANFYGNAHEAYKSLGAFGTGIMFVDELVGAELPMRYYQPFLGDTYYFHDPYGVTDTVYRAFQFEAKQALQQWPRAAATLGSVQKKADQDPYAPCEFLQVVHPRTQADRFGKVGAARMPYESAYLSVEDRVAVEVGGYNELPYAISRYSLAPREKYGRSPAMLALPNINTLQEMQRTILRAGQMAVDPALLLYDDEELGFGKDVRLYPGGLNFGGVTDDGRPRILPLETGANMPIAFEMLERERAVIEEVFLVRLLQTVYDHPQKTATEVLKIAQEQGWLLTPTIGRQQSEFLGPLVEREVGVFVRSGRIRPPPRVLLEARGDYRIEYVSPAMTHQRAGELLALNRALEFGMTVAAAKGDPSCLDVIDEEEGMRAHLEIFGAPARTIRSPEAVAKLRAARLQATQQQQMLAAGEQMAKIARDASAAQPAPGAPGGVAAAA